MIGRLASLKTTYQKGTVTNTLLYTATQLVTLSVSASNQVEEEVLISNRDFPTVDVTRKRKRDADVALFDAVFDPEVNVEEDGSLLRKRKRRRLQGGDT